MDFKNKNIAILGLGIEGVALVSFLRDEECNISVRDRSDADDLLKNSEGELHSQIESVLSDGNIEKVFGEEYLERLDQYDIIFRSPGIYFKHPKLIEAEEKGVEISSQIKLFFDLAPCRIIGVSGTKGKGTTASLISEILKKNFQLPISNYKLNYQPPTTDHRPNVYLAGNIGTPAISLIPELKPEDIVILELSSFQLSDMEKSPQIAVVTNVGMDHLDYHQDEDEYRMAKFNLLAHQKESDTCILNADSSFDPSLLAKVQSKELFFAEKDGGEADARVMADENTFAVILKNGEKICRLDEIKLLGRHNLQNIAAATLVASEFNVPSEVIREAVKSFAGLSHRLELAAEIEGVKFINDSFATNPGPTIAAVSAFSEDKVLILGGSYKGSDFSELATVISSSNVKGVVLIGAEGSKIKDSLERAGYQGKIEGIIIDLGEAISAAQNLADSGDVVIFSPACASFDMFRNYKDRGEKFKAIVKSIKR